MARKTQPKTALDGIETGPMSVPKMDRISVTFALMLDSFRIENYSDTAKMLTCDHCGSDVCLIEHGDDLRTLFNTALAHTC